MNNVILMPPRGHYLANEVGALAGVSGDRVGQWARRGYIRASWSKLGDSPLVYSFQDVAEAMLVHELEDQGVPLGLIKLTVNGLRLKHGNWPLQAAELEVDSSVLGDIPVAVIAVLEDGERFEATGRGWQALEDVTVNPRRISLDLHRGGWAVRLAPDLRHIEVDPDRLSGKPVIRGRRVPVSLVAEAADDADGLEILREDYQLTDGEIADAKRWTDITRSFSLAA
jgi:uncharacterized protein (DUF433 family)